MNKYYIKFFLNPRFIFYSLVIILFYSNYSYLTTAPYWDGITSSFWQAVWLLRNKWDYISLFHETNYYGGGPNNYFFSILPLFYSVLYVFFKPVTVFFILHILNIVAGAVIFTVFYKMLSLIVKPFTALVLCVAALVNPVFNGQCIALNMEIFTAAACSISLLYFFHNNFQKSFIWVSFAIFIKFSAVILVLAYCVWYICLFVYSLINKSSTIKELVYSKKTYILLPVLLIPLFYIVQDNVTISRFEYGAPFIRRFVHHIWMFFPSYALLFLFNIFGIVRYVKKVMKNGRENEKKYFSIIFVISLFLSGFWLSYILTISPLPRYTTYVIFPLFALAGILWRDKNRLLIWGGIFFILWGILNLDGRFLPKLDNHLSRAGAYLERSREYLIDLESKRRISLFLQTYFFTDSIIVGRDFAFMLSFPEMGFVSKAFPMIYTDSNVSHYIGGRYLAKSDFHAFKGAIQVFVPAFCNFPDISKKDTIYKIDKSLPGWPVVIFKKN